MDDQDTGIWALWYDLAEETRDAYCDWFHHVHIPEKLARPGYRWAAHYRLGHGGRGQGWLALFGGASAHTFLAPPPSELATRQSALTRQHMAMRRPLGSAIFAQEVRVDGPEARHRDPRASAPVVQFGHYDAPDAATDEAIGSFYAQQRFPLGGHAQAARERRRLAPRRHVRVHLARRARTPLRAAGSRGARPVDAHGTGRAQAAACAVLARGRRARVAARRLRFALSRRAGTREPPPHTPAHRSRPRGTTSPAAPATVNPGSVPATPASAPPSPARSPRW